MNDDKTNKCVLVAYYSLSGNTARVARDLAARLNADIESIQDLEHGTGLLGRLAAVFDALRKAPASIGTIQHDPTAYELIVVGTPVWVGQMTPAVRAYLQAIRGRTRNVALFVTSGNTGIEKIAPSMETLAERQAAASIGFNAKELAAAATYKERLDTFAASVERALASD